MGLGTVLEGTLRENSVRTILSNKRTPRVRLGVPDITALWLERSLQVVQASG